MSFSGFTNEARDFLWELSFNNERPWFLEHKEQFERCFQQPFKALAAETLALIGELVPDRELWCHCSRIYRDARRLFGRGPYKDHLWFTIQRGDVTKHGPAFWFELGARGYSYGVGFWECRPEQTAAFRALIDANPARFERIALALDKLPEFRVFGAEYKKPKGDRGPMINKWYNRKYMGIECAGDFDEALLGPELPEKLADAFQKLLPLYDFFVEVYHAAPGDEDR